MNSPLDPLPAPSPGNFAGTATSLAQQAPRTLIIAALFYWGLANDSLLAASCISLVLMGQYFVQWRWEFSDDRFTDMHHLCLLILLGSAVSIWSATNDGFQTFIVLFKWLPLIFMPLFGAQIYSTTQTVSLKTFFQALRLKEREEIRSGRAPTPISRVALDYPYFILIMAAASASNQTSLPFYLAAMVLVSWAVWQQHSNRVHLWVTVVLICVVSGLGYAGQLGLFNLQRVVENWNWFSLFDDETDLKMSTTAIGSVRDVKLGGKIVMRVKKMPGQPVPSLLQEATYTNWSTGRWNAEKGFRDEVTVSPTGTGDDKAFPLLEPPKPGEPVKKLTEKESRDYVTTLLGTAKVNREFLLALPPGTRKLEGMPLMTVRRTPSGAVRVAPDRPAYSMTVHFNPDGPRIDRDPEELPPGSGQFTSAESSLPGLYEIVDGETVMAERDRPALRSEIEVVSKLSDDLGLRKLSPPEAAAKIRAYFQTNFSYSLSSRHGSYQSRSSHSPLVDFLRTNREGHCEYFATATVLLLRAAGIPARYAVGYSVQEYSSLEKLYLVRSLHAHAWAIGYWDGHWHEVDSTPSGWVSSDSKHLPFWQPARDFFGALWSGFNQWRANGGADSIRQYAPWVVFATLLLIGGRSLFGKGAKRRLMEKQALEDVLHLGRDSAFYPVMGELARLYEPPVRGETALNWLRRLQPQIDKASPPTQTQLPQLLDEVLGVHYRYRFDPEPMSSEESQRLNDLAQRCLTLLKAENATIAAAAITPRKR